MHRRHTVCISCAPDDIEAQGRFIARFGPLFFAIVTEPTEAEVHIVLVGNQTWRKAKIDQRIAAGLDRPSDDEHGGALMGVLLTDREEAPPLSARAVVGAATLHPTVPREGNSYWCRQVPRRLHLNINGKRAQMRPWRDNDESMSGWVHDAFMARKRHPANNALAVMEVDYTDESTHWMANAADVDFEINLSV